MNDEVPLLELLPLSEEAGAYALPPEHLDALVAAAEALGLWHRRVDLSGCRDKQTLLALLARDLAFPEWFGDNWDALADCLSDLGWIDSAKGYVLILDGTQDLRQSAQDDYDTLIEVLDDAAQGWHEVALPFWAFLCERDTGRE